MLNIKTLHQMISIRFFKNKLLFTPAAFQLHHITSKWLLAIKKKVQKCKQMEKCDLYNNVKGKINVHLLKKCTILTSLKS